MPTSDCLIIGGGIIGMLTALELAEAGQTVTLLERSRCGEEASWAGGGIISPLYPWRQPDAITQLATVSQQLYPELTNKLITATGIDPEYRLRGLLYADPEDVVQAWDWAQRYEQSLIPVDSAFVHTRAPQLTRNIDQALWMPKLGSIRNPRLGQAMRQRLGQLPQVALHEHTAVQRLRHTAKGVVADCANATYAGGYTMLCGGAWSGHLAKQLGLSLPVRPVKGQMLLFRPRQANTRASLKQVVLRHGHYLIPRDDGRILVGSTLEPNAQFDQGVTEQAREQLHSIAMDIMPALADYAIEHHWAGLRPGAPEGLAYIGPVPDVDGLYINTGHYRNGLVLAPASAHLVADHMLGRLPITDPTPFLPETLGLPMTQAAAASA